MYPNNSEWAQLGVLFLLGPFHVLACVILTTLAWWRAPHWSMSARLTVLAINVVLACAPVVMGLSTGDENRGFHQYALAIAACELLAVGGLAGVLIFRRAAVATPQ